MDQQIVQKNVTLTKNDTMSAGLTPEARKTRAMIVSTAERHFKRYGFAKTTIVEIADDCAMSHANVYRFFRNKAELADAVATLWLAKIVEAGRHVVQEKGSARERLVNLALELYRIKKREMLRTKRVYELLLQAEINGQPSMEAFHRHISGLYTAVIEDGQARGEFRKTNIAGTVLAIQTALIKFGHPLLLEQFQDHDLEPLLRGIVETMVTGIAATS